MCSCDKVAIHRFVLVLKVIVVGFSLLDTAVSSHKELPKKHLIVSATRSPLVKDKELTTVSLGLVEEILLDVLSNHLNFSYEIRPPTDILTSGYLQPNGTWTGSAGQLHRGEVDMSVTTISLTSSKSLIMDVSHPVVMVDTGIIIPFPRQKNKWVDASAFQSPAWMALAVTFSFMVFITWLIHRITDKSKLANKSEGSFTYWILFFICIWTLQGVSLRNTSTPFRLVILFSVIGIYIISNYFTAAYTSVLSTPLFKTSVSSIEDLANSVTVKTLIAKATGTDEYFMTATDPTTKKIGDQLRRYPERRILNTFTVEDISTIVKDDFALVMIKSIAESMIQTSYQINKECRVTLAEKFFLSRPQGFTYPKKSPIAAFIDYDLLLMHQSGLILYAERRASTSSDRCSVSAMQNADNVTKPVALRLDELIGAFLIFIVGTGLSFLLFFVELAAKLVPKKARNTASKK